MLKDRKYFWWVDLLSQEETNSVKGGSGYENVGNSSVLMKGICLLKPDKMKDINIH